MCKSAGLAVDSATALCTYRSFRNYPDCFDAVYMLYIVNTYFCTIIKILINVSSQSGFLWFGDLFVVAGNFFYPCRCAVTIDNSYPSFPFYLNHHLFFVMCKSVKATEIAKFSHYALFGAKVLRTHVVVS